jgi:hypothetical protein
MKSTPRKLNTAAKMTAFLGVMDFVETAVAIAFGASVQPLIKITSSVNSDVIRSM